MDKYYNKNIKYIGESLDNNKFLIFSVIILSSLYASTYVDDFAGKISWLVDTSSFKFIMFIFLSIVSGRNPSLGIALTIAILVTLQVISNLNMKKEMQDLNTGLILKKNKAYQEKKQENNESKESFENIENNYSQIQPSDYQENVNEFYYNPVAKLDNLSPTMGNLDLEFETPNQLYSNMVKQGKNLLDNGIELENDIKKRYDSREKNISDISKRDGIMMIQSGLNRLEKADLGEYNNSFINNNIKYIEPNELINNFSSNPDVIKIYNQFLKEYTKLKLNNIDKKEFYNQIITVYKTKLELLKTILDNSKNMDETKAKKLNQLIDKLSSNYGNSLDEWINNINKLSDILL